MSMLHVDFHAPEPQSVAVAVAVLRAGEVIAYLTDTLYGLGVDPRQPEAIARLFGFKQRPAEKALPVIAATRAMLAGWVAEVPPVAEALMQQFWPGPLTMILTAGPAASESLTAGTGKLAVRVPASPVARALSAALGAPITATSANLSGRRVAMTAPEIMAELGSSVALVLDSGPATSDQPTTLLDVTVTPPRLVRAGALSETELIKRVGAIQK